MATLGQHFAPFCEAAATAPMEGPEDIPMDTLFLASLAISAKRIADLLEDAFGPVGGDDDG